LTPSAIPDPQEPERQKAEIGRAIALLNELKAKIG